MIIIYSLFIILLFSFLFLCLSLNNIYEFGDSEQQMRNDKVTYVEG